MRQYIPVSKSRTHGAGCKHVMLSQTQPSLYIIRHSSDDQRFPMSDLIDVKEEAVMGRTFISCYIKL